MTKVLVIDDIEFTRETICKILRRNGFEVYEASNGREGVELYQKYEPEVVLTDILMPEMEGLETIKKLVHLCPGLPIIAITGSVDTPFMNIALKFGAVDGLYKPFKQDQLLEAIHKALQSRSN
ncbi:MAG: response regulator [Calditrichaeota bacterium]|nr:MAG: response regulator [Calditrichota bacterium]